MGCWIRASYMYEWGFVNVRPYIFVHNIFTPDLITRKYHEHLNSLKFHHDACFFFLWLCMHEPSSPANAIVRSYWLFVHYNPGTKWSVLVFCWFGNHYFMMWLLGYIIQTLLGSNKLLLHTHTQNSVNIMLCPETQVWCSFAFCMLTLSDNILTEWQVLIIIKQIQMLCDHP